MGKYHPNIFKYIGCSISFILLTLYSLSKSSDFSSLPWLSCRVSTGISPHLHPQEPPSPHFSVGNLHSRFHELPFLGFLLVLVENLPQQLPEKELMRNNSVGFLRVWKCLHFVFTIHHLAVCQMKGWKEFSFRISLSPK